ncbi:nucleotidyltransferase family protein [Metabacillus elymi]|uniref:Nucleotidyltransferase family protein n=1 Tax=Metabacillus elymi TaxID=2745198 RepID=A0ABX6RWW2_9BACI|nr:nucleotidyltransferase family protein [Metabacillus sp. KUDC1714]QNF26175.1 nucleotidyltransferase family protein [Metabacillus sp. KUDC1714]
MLINFLQSLYDHNSSLPSEAGDYERLIDDIEYFSISPQVYFHLKQQDRLELTPPFFQNRLKNTFNQVLIQNLFIKNQTEKILSILDQLGIPAIPLKGVLFAEKYFGHIAARSTSDIDLLIKPHDLDRVTECVKELGYIMEEEGAPGHFHCSLSKELPGSPVPLVVEIHWDILKENTSEFSIKEFWEQSTPFKHYENVKQLSDYHTFYMICLHAWRHNLDSMKHFLDITQMIHVMGNHIDYINLFNVATRHKTLNRMKRTLSIVYRNFPHVKEIKTLPFLYQKGFYWQYEAIRDSSFRNVKVYIDYFDYLFFSFDTVKHRLIAINEWLLPSEYHLTLELRTEKRISFKDYLTLYNKRCFGFLKSVFLHK